MRQWHFGCSPHSWSKLVRTIRSLLVAIIALNALCAFFSRSVHRRADVATRPSTQVDLVVDEGDEDAGEVDLFGNDVTDAMARYAFDATGSLYEVHSPQTEIPKLGSPKS